MATRASSDLAIHIALVGDGTSVSALRAGLDGWTLPHSVEIVAGTEAVVGGSYDVAVLAAEVGADTVSGIVAAERGMGVVVHVPGGGAEQALELLQAGAEDVLIGGDVDPVALRQSILLAVGRSSVRCSGRDAVANGASELRFRAIVEQSVEPIVVIDRFGAIVLANAPAGRLLGSEGTPLIGRELGVLVTSVMPAELEVSVRDGRQTRRIGLRFRAIVWQEQTVYLATLSDRVERQRDGRRSRELSCRQPAASEDRPFPYEPLVASESSGAGSGDDLGERTTAREQLIYAQKMEAIGRLAGGVAHDFNNLLHAFSGLSHALRRCRDPAQVDESLDALDDLVERGSQLSHQLLLLSRRQSPEPERLDLGGALAATESFVRRVLREDIELICDLDSLPMWVSIHRGHLDQVIVNLVLNAQDAMPEGGPLRLTATRRREHAILECEDSGSGVASSLREKVFEPFFTTKDVGRGTGLGLSVVRDIVHLSGGTIEVGESRYGGALFRVAFPLVAQGGHEDDVVAKGGAVPGGHNRNRRVLLVEDHPRVREGLELMLQHLGCEVVAVGCCQAARDLDPAGPFDVLLTDRLLPDGSGDSLARELEQRWPAMSVVLMSGYSDTAGWTQPAGPGRQVLAKPFTARELERVLCSLGAPQAQAVAVR